MPELNSKSQFQRFCEDVYQWFWAPHNSDGSVRYSQQ